MEITVDQAKEVLKEAGIIQNFWNKEEYRDLTKYYQSRLLKEYMKLWNLGILNENQDNVKEFDVVEFRNGYGLSVPSIRVEFKGVEIREGNPDWGAEKGVEYFVIKLGKVLIDNTLR